MKKDKVMNTIRAYREGSFPMAEDGALHYYNCNPRSIFFFDSFHIPKRLKRIAKQKPFQFSRDKVFEKVVQCCRQNRSEWISDELLEIYLELHQMGIAHSFEAWDNEVLVGGLYGTHFGAAFLAESMFHSKSHASNLCLLYLMDCLKRSGFHFCDIQYANEHTKRFNPIDIPHEQFYNLLKRALDIPVTFKDD